MTEGKVAPDAQASLQKTMVFVTHDFAEAVRIADRIAIMKDGSICQVGTPEEIVSAPADNYVRAFVAGVDLTRVIRCATVARPMRQESYTVTLPGHKRLADAAALLLPTGTGTLGITDDAGRLLGELDSTAILAAVSARSPIAAAAEEGVA